MVKNNADLAVGDDDENTQKDTSDATLMQTLSITSRGYGHGYVDTLSTCCTLKIRARNRGFRPANKHLPNPSV